MDKNESNLNDSAEEPFKEGYSKDLTRILTKNAAEHSATIKVIEDLEWERLTMEHTEMDKKIAAILKRIEKSQQKNQDLDRQIYKATELKNYAMTCFERTGEMTKVLKETTEDIKDQSKKAKAKYLEISGKVEELTVLKSNIEQKKEKIDRLELNIKNILGAPEPLLDQVLVSDNKDVKNKLEDARKRLQLKRATKSKIDNIKEEKLKTLLLINAKQEENKVVEEELGKKIAYLKELEKQLQCKLTIFQERFNNDAEKQKQLQETKDKLLQNNEKTLKNIEEKKKIIAQKEDALQDLKKKIEPRQMMEKEEKLKKEREHESEKKKLATADQKLESGLTDLEQHRKALLEKSSHLYNLKDQECKLIIKLCDSKNKLIVQQHQNADQQSKVDILSNKLEAETRQLDEVKAKNLQLDEKLEDLKNQLEQLPLKQAEARDKLMWNHKEKIEGLLKQQNYQKATMEFLQLRLEEGMKKIDQLRKEIQEFDDNIKWDQMKCEMRKKTAEKLEEIAIKEQASYDKLNAELKKKEDLKRRGQKKPFVLEKKEESSLIEGEESKTSQSGRKSPGILKSPFKSGDAPVASNKRVTFQGLSSTESSSVDHDAFDDLLRNWGESSRPFTSRKRPLDF